MTEADSYWSIANVGPEPLRIWLEPWAEAFEVAPRSDILLKSSTDAGSYPFEIEQSPDHIVVWASTSLVEVFIDNMVQESVSSRVAVPEALTKGMKDTLHILFGNAPGARLGGRTDPPSWWQRVKARFRHLPVRRRIGDASGSVGKGRR